MSVAGKRLVRSRVALRIAAAGVLLALAFVSQLATAHSNEYLEKIKGPNGGQVRMAEMFHFEVVVNDGKFRVWVTDHADNAIPTAGASGSAVLLYGTERVSVNLVPDGANRLLALDKRIRKAADARITLTVAMKGQKALHARYAPVPAQ